MSDMKRLKAGVHVEVSGERSLVVGRDVFALIITDRQLKPVQYKTTKINVKILRVVCSRIKKRKTKKKKRRCILYVGRDPTMQACSFLYIFHNIFPFFTYFTFQILMDGSRWENLNLNGYGHQKGRARSENSVRNYPI